MVVRCRGPPLAIRSGGEQRDHFVSQRDEPPRGLTRLADDPGVRLVRGQDQELVGASGEHSLSQVVPDLDSRASRVRHGYRPWGQSPDPGRPRDEHLEQAPSGLNWISWMRPGWIRAPVGGAAGEAVEEPNAAITRTLGNRRPVRTHGQGAGGFRVRSIRPGRFPLWSRWKRTSGPRSRIKARDLPSRPHAGPT